MAKSVRHIRADVDLAERNAYYLLGSQLRRYHSEGWKYLVLIASNPDEPLKLFLSGIGRLACRTTWQSVKKVSVGGSWERYQIGNLCSRLAQANWLSPQYTHLIVLCTCSRKACWLIFCFLSQALNQSSQTEGTRPKEIAPATHAVCFLGTPHRGSNSASIGKLAYQIKVVATKRPNVKLLQALERNSETLDRVGDAFRQTLLKQKIHIYSFREEKETRKFLLFSSIIVNTDSAKIGDATEEVGSIPENHSNMTKFATASDIGFKRVSSQLRRWIEGIRSSEPGRQAVLPRGS